MGDLNALERAALVERNRRAGKRSGEVRRAKAELREDLKARMLFVEAAEELAREMLDAAMGRGVYAALDPKERAGLLKTCLEYAVGRPRPQDPLARDEDEEEAPKTGFRFGVAEADGGSEDGREEVESGPGEDAEHTVPG